jgi:hypothetical protein
MLPILVLMLQTATLDADNYKAAITCAQALTISDASSKSPMQLTSQFTHLMMQAARAKPEGAFFEQLNALSANASNGATMQPAQANLLAPLCDRRFPIARSTAPARLPRDSFHRDVLCFGTLSVLQGAAEEIAKSGSETGLTKIRAGLKPLTDRLTDDELKKRGLGADGAFMKALGDEMLASLPAGNPLTVATACGVTGI